MFRNFKSVSMLLLLGGISSGVAYAVPARGASGTNIVQQGSVCKGVVKDATGETIIGASIVVEGTKNAAVTNIDGNFELSNVSKGATIVISYLGLSDEENRVGRPAAQCYIGREQRTETGRGGCHCLGY